MQRRNYDSGTTQEWKVFRALCPPELMAILDDPNIKPITYDALCRMFQALGFAHLANEYRCTKHLRFPDQDHTLDQRDQKLLPVYTQPLINLFLANIHSPGLRALFEKKTTTSL